MAVAQTSSVTPTLRAAFLADFSRVSFIINYDPARTAKAAANARARSSRERAGGKSVNSGLAATNPVSKRASSKS